MGVAPVAMRGKQDWNGMVRMPTPPLKGLAMKAELLHPTATIIAAMITTDADRSSTGHRVGCQELFVATYRKLEAAMLQIEKEDQAKLEARREPQRDYA